MEYNGSFSVVGIKVAVEEQGDEADPSQGHGHQDPLATPSGSGPLEPNRQVLADDVAEVVGQETEDRHEVDVGPVVV